jgi:SHS2 domain-containing protein
MEELIPSITNLSVHLFQTNELNFKQHRRAIVLLKDVVFGIQDRIIFVEDMKKAEENEKNPNTHAMRTDLSKLTVEEIRLHNLKLSAQSRARNRVKAREVASINAAAKRARIKAEKEAAREESQ